MKLRFRKNSLRLRLNQREVEGLASGASIKEQVQFPGNSSMSYVLESSSNLNAAASFQQGVIRVSAPHVDVRDWAGSESVGIYFELPANGCSLKVAIEKDLECVDGPPDESDPYAFPRGSAESC